jgi:hypothetical protein
VKHELLSSYTEQGLSVLGGEFSVQDLGSFIRDLPVKLEWSICEYTDRCVFIKAKVPELTNLERTRVFGSGGDLEIRRDREKYFWRFVGPVDIIFNSCYKPVDFWCREQSKEVEERITRLYCHEENLVLWGECGKDSVFNEGRVAAARLEYPVDCGYKGRAVIKAKVYTYYGRPQFVWYTALEGWE